MKLSDYVMDFVAALGVRHVFMLPGGGAMHLNDSLGRHPRLRYVCNLHEQGCAVAAEAYGQLGGLGVALVTTGPGGTNALTGVAAAWLESTPLLILSGQVKRADLVGDRGVRQIGFQEIDIVRMASPVTKHAVTVLEPRDIRRCLEEAVWRATHGRKGPVWVDIPLDVQAAEVEPAELPGFTPPAAEGSSAAALVAAVEKTLALLARARRPVLLAGNGLRHAGAVGDFLAWAERRGLPVLTTWKALDFLPDDHPLCIGRPGAVGQRAANFAQQFSDLFISLGARLDYGQTAYNHAHFAPMAAKVVVDIDPAEIAKLQMPLAVALAADAGDFVRALAAADTGGAAPEHSAWLGRCRDWRRRYPIVLPEYRRVTGGVHNYVFVDELGRQLRAGDVLVPGSSGACSEVTAQAVPVVAPIRFLNCHGLGAMGFGVPAALGASLAAGAGRTVCVDGDGGFVMNAQELAVIGRLRLPVKFFVLNNGGYGAIRTTQINYFQRRFVACDEASGLTLPDLELTARASRVGFARIASPEDLAAQIRAVLESEGPVVCEVMMAPDQFTQPKVSSRQLPDGRMQTMPMEDLWPFLERAEFERVRAEALGGP